MDNIKKVPDIRFKGFYEEWEQGFLKDNVEFYSGLTYKPSDVCKKSSSSVLVIRSSNIKNGKFVINNDDVYVKEEALNSTKTEMNDITVVVRNGSRHLIGKHGIVTKYLKKATVGAFMTGIRAYRFDFINVLLDTNAFRKQVDENMGATINQITNSTLNSMYFYFPNSNEQTQIGNFFKNLDEKLELEKEKHEKLINFKKAMLEDMFPKEEENVPKIRFEWFDDEWKTEQLGNISTYSNGMTYENEVCNNGRYELINLNSVSIDGGLKSSGKYIDNAFKTLSKNDLVMILSDVAHGNLLGRVALIPEDNKYVLNQRVASLSSTIDYNPYFLLYFINSKQQYFKKKGAGSSQLNISKNTVERFLVKFPSPEEQALIGNFFKNLDEKIELSEKKIKKIENFKKAMLDKMFV